MQKPGAEFAWQMTLRFVVGGYWLLFSYQKWFDRSWVGEMLRNAAYDNYVPVYGAFLRNVIVPNSQIVALLVTIIEAAVGLVIILGVAIRTASIVGCMMDLNLLLTFGPSTNDFPLIFWFYFTPLLLNLQLYFDVSHEMVGLRALTTRYLSKSHASQNSRKNKTLCVWQIHSKFDILHSLLSRRRVIRGPCQPSRQ